MSRSSNYNNDEDVLLCLVYMEISQDPITGKYQSADRFWSRVEDTYNEQKNEGFESRTKRSLQSRIQTIEKAVRKLNGCIHQVENMHLSGASEKDIMHRAKTLLMQDKNYKKGFKFDHVWDIVKNFEKFKDDVIPSRKTIHLRDINDVTSESNNPSTDSPISTSPRLSSFSIHLDDTSGGSASERPIGVKKAKLKRKIDGESLLSAEAMKEGHQAILNMLEKNDLRRQHQLDLQERNLLFKQKKHEDRILDKDLSTITDPKIYDYVKAEQSRILEKRSQQDKQAPSNSGTNEFDNYFTNLGGSGSDLPDY